MPAPPLDKRSFVPLYTQIQRALMERILCGELKEGDALESEEELSRRYQVSRMTARQALHGLKLGGYAVSERGRGTFVTEPKLGKDILLLQSFTEQMAKMGMAPSSRLLLQRSEPAGPELAALLGIAEREPVLYLRRLRLANESPIAIEDSRVVMNRFPGIDKIDFSDRSLYEALRHRYGAQFGWAEETIEAAPARKEEADLLVIPKRSSLLCVTRRLMMVDGTPIEYAISRYRGDRYRASLRIPMALSG
jgi:GntR family transcriptional regulator